MSIPTDIKRIFRSGFHNFWRNGLVSFVSVLTMTVTLFVVGMLIFLNAVLSFSLAQMQEKVDINVYFFPTTNEENVLALKTDLEALPEVSEVEYISREQAIEDFRLRHEDDSLVLRALEELSENPLGASLNIRATEAGQYATVAKFLEPENESISDIQPYIETVNYNRNKEIIERLDNIINTVQKIGFVVSLFFVVISILIVMNTIRLAIYASREEIQTMRLIGASSRYVQGPFMITGVIYGVLSGVITSILLYPVSLWIGKQTSTFFGGINIFTYYTNNFAQIFILLIVAGIVLAGIGSLFASRAYMKK